MADAAQALQALLQVMRQLRDPESGCPWDQQQTFASIAPYTLEEAYEVAAAIDAGDPQQLRDELGDLLFQVVFHAQMASERGWFDFAAVAQAIHDKLVRRHPHVFAGAQAGDARTQSRMWEELKAAERATESAKANRAASALEGIPRALPALARAAKIGRRAARVGFDWQETAQVRAKVLEEVREVDAALAAGAHAAVTEEMGDLLFALANWSLHLQIDPEEALRHANLKFERRFRHMETLAAARGLSLQALTPSEWDALWNQAKRM
ncbi:MAG TPA: nucleoside triphosphate pyrophosphohydrolase [Steroidobacteraceae bacterium]|nr:nucleoside triphosphate pyrophosphohydrolase [Steroidobacteraceae bacterium]